jgi:hypothetical protein
VELLADEPPKLAAEPAEPADADAGDADGAV